MLYRIVTSVTLTITFFGLFIYILFGTSLIRGDWKPAYCVIEGSHVEYDDHEKQYVIIVSTRNCDPERPEVDCFRTNTSTKGYYKESTAILDKILLVDDTVGTSKACSVSASQQKAHLGKEPPNLGRFLIATLIMLVGAGFSLSIVMWPIFFTRRGSKNH